MKKILSLLSLFIVLISCSTDTDETNVRYELIPIQNVTISDHLLVGEANQITVQYNRPSDCHGFNGFYYEKNGFTRTIAVQNYVYEREGCSPLTNELREEVLEFKPTEVGTYTFKFWQGKDSNGNDIFLEVQIDAIIE